MPRIAIPMGRDFVELALTPEQQERVTLLEGTALPPLPDPVGAVAASLAAPLGGPPLAQLARGKRSACVVVSDITRPVPNPLILPPLLAALENAGMPREGITILIATGMHRANTGPELIELLGPEVAGAYRVVNHDCRDAGALAEIGRIDGNPIALNRLYLEAELKIVTGLIEPHPFAGFSGGAKSILPGVASLESMKHMHSYAMVADPRLAGGRLEDNPFQEQVRRIGAKAGLDFLLNVVIDRERRLLGIFAGAFPEAHDQGCALAARQSVVRVDQPFDLVVTNGGGHPLDATLYQASKGLLAARPITRPGGAVLWLVAASEGLGSPEYCAMVTRCGDAAGFRAAHGAPEDFVVDQWGAQCYFQCLDHMERVLLHSPGVTPEQAAAFGLEQVPDLGAAWQELLAAYPRVAVMPEGPYLCPVLAV
ncbi:MAG: nickel-dependent lactate racemase [Desulfarculaceae bacterium]|nr:nickel-dependent lactate racemase [Desulfarculaceae bacterium]